MIRPRILVFLLATVIVAIWFAPESREVVEPLARRSEQKAAAPETQVVLAAVPDLSKSPPSFERAAEKLLGEPPAAPKGPKLRELPSEFQVLGKAQLGDSWKAVISVAGKTHMAGTGDRIDDRFVIEKFDPPTLVVVDLAQAGHRFILPIGDLR